MAKKYDNEDGSFRYVLHSAEIEEELDRTRQRLALNAAPAEVEEELEKREVHQAA